METSRVLVVEDEPDVRQLLELTLGLELGLEVVAAVATGAAAVDAARRTEPDLVVLDLGLPDLPGLDVIGLLLAAAPAARIVVFSARDDRESKTAALARGAAAYVPKADHITRLSDVLRDLAPGTTVPTALGDRRTVELRGHPTDPRRARAAATEAAGEWGCPEIQDSLALVVSELVTNAVTHGRGPWRLRLVRRTGYLRVEVLDHGEHPPTIRDADEDSEHGRGLFLIDALTTAWGVEPETEGGKTVWAELPC